MVSYKELSGTDSDEVVERKEQQQQEVEEDNREAIERVLKKRIGKVGGESARVLTDDWSGAVTPFLHFSISPPLPPPPLPFPLLLSLLLLSLSLSFSLSPLFSLQRRGTRPPAMEVAVSLLLGGREPRRCSTW